MAVLVTGSSGLVGSALIPALRKEGERVVRLVRRPPRKDDELRWQPDEGVLDAQRLAGFEAVIHLAGESIALGRWTAGRKARIRDSRVLGTRLLCDALTSLHPPPRVLITASAVGYYGDRGDEPLTEASGPGEGFLAAVARDWEAAAAPAASAGVRVVHLRLGLVLSTRGGALPRLLLPFRLGLGGRLGTGRQWWSWIALDDLIAAFQHALATETLRGPVNAVAPTAVANADFTRVLSRVLSRPAFLPAPAFGLRLLLGEMADALLLASQRVRPERLVASGFAFRHPELEGALRHVLQANP